MNIDFETLYKQLNTRQKEAVDAIDGPVMVIAGPGTGKTQILALRIANILKKTDAKPDEILALTFTEAGVISMRARLLSIIGSEAYKINIHTFHGLAKRIIDENADMFPKIIGAEVANDAHKLRIVGDALTVGDYKIIRPFGEPTHNATKVIEAISKLKRERVSPMRFEKIINEYKENLLNRSDIYHEKGRYKGKIKGEYLDLIKDLEKNLELASVYAKYETALSEERLYDYEDMILEVLSLFEKDEDFLRMYQERFQFILVDEHQDTNDSQNAFLSLLADFHESPNIFVVGDEKQAIYRFQGASLANFFGFKKKYPSAKLISLDTNYRSNPHILDNAHEIADKMPRAEGISREKLVAGSKHQQSPIRIFPAFDRDAELNAVASRVMELKNHDPKAEIAILYGENNDAKKIEDVLLLNKIPFVTISKTNALNSSAVIRLIDIAKAVGNPDDDSALGRLLFMNAFGVPVLFSQELLEKRDRQDSLWITILKSDKKEIVDMSRVLSKLVTIAKDKTAKDLILAILGEEKIRNMILADGDADENILAVKSFVNFIDRLSLKEAGSISKLLKLIELYETFNVSIPFAKPESEGKVKLMTIHGSKGKEFDHCIIENAFEGHISGKKDRKYFKLDIIVPNGTEDKSDDERRLFYVALTRGKKTVDIFYPTHKDDGKELLPTSFVSELKPELVVFENEIPQEVSLPILSEKTKTLDQELIKRIFLGNSLSSTAVNNFALCPWKYYFVNLMRIPEPYTETQMFGTSIHAGLENIWNEYRETGKLNAKTGLSSFEKTAKSFALSESQFDKFMKRATAVFKAYTLKHKGVLYENVETERSLKTAITIDGVDRPIRFSGKIDLMHTRDGDIHVIDFKTGKAKSKNAMMGKNADGDRSFWNQVVAYRMLVDREVKEGKFKDATFEFVVPDDNGVIKDELLLIESDDVADFLRLISEMAKSILSGEFAKHGCGDCEYCRLAELAYLIS